MQRLLQQYTAADKMDAAVVLANGQFDQAVLESAQAELEADDSAVATALTAINTQVDAYSSRFSIPSERTSI